VSGERLLLGVFSRLIQSTTLKEVQPFNIILCKKPLGVITFMNNVILIQAIFQANLGRL